ncbi:hypothetical protein GW915_01665 [bacterium]|nr:hypothetical protein [bacterium]
METAELKALVGKASGYTRRETLRFSLCPEPLPRGALIEVTGFGKSEFVAEFLAEHKHQAIWLEESFNLNPLAFLQRQISLKNIHFVEAEHNLFWASAQVISSGLYDSIVINQPNWDLKQFRKIQLMAEKNNQLIFLLAKTPLNAWPISLSLQVKHRFFNKDFQVQIRRKRSFYR